MDPAHDNSPKFDQTGQETETPSNVAPQQITNQPTTNPSNPPSNQFEPNKNKWQTKNDPLHPHLSKAYGESAKNFDANKVPSVAQTTPSVTSQPSAENPYGTGRIDPGSLSEFGPNKSPTTNIQPDQILQGSGEPDTGPKKSKLKLVLFFFLLVIFLVITATGALAYAVAYEKVKLEKYPDLQRKVTYAVQSVPFMPKTPKFLLAKSAMAHQDVTKQTYNLSLAVDSDDLVSSLGVNSFDIEAKGAIDYSNPKNVLFTLDTSITKDFNFELRKKDKFLYFRINKLPSFLLSVFGMKSDDFAPILGQWVAYDTTPLDTEARKSLQDKEVDPLSEEYLDENLDKFIDDTVTNELKMDETKLDGRDVYKITLDADPDLIDHIGTKLDEEISQESGSTLQTTPNTEPEKLSDVIKAFHVEIYVDKNDYYNRKNVITVDVESDNTTGASTGSPFLGAPSAFSSGKSKMSLAFVSQFDNFGESVFVEVPQSTMTFDEFTEKLSEIFQNMYGSYMQSATGDTSYSQSSDVRIISDLTNISYALEAYYVTCTEYPQDLLQLTEDASGCAKRTGAELYALPTDPTGADYYYKVSADKQSYDLCAKMDDPPRSTSTCPDPKYNFHTTNP